jgi:hypothetical protein
MDRIDKPTPPGDGNQECPVPTAGSSALPGPFLTEKRLAARWGLSEKTLRNHRSAKKGCPYFSYGFVRYALSDVLEFERQHTHLSPRDWDKEHSDDDGDKDV